MVPQERESRVAQNKDLVADAQTLLEENLSEKKSVESEKKSVESARRLILIDYCRWRQLLLSMELT